MKVTIENADLQGKIKAIPSKSYAHRMLICAALSDSPCMIECSETSADITATAGCMSGLCADIVRTESGYHVNPGKAHEKAAVDCGESGSTFRFILPVACALGTETDFSLHGRLPERPMDVLYRALEANGI
ncbi:MAG: 3-phosphoshikimate 1-carboxyvinyltransferase, partial [Christensenellaceae bacterium]|nr:3-phosphoshikimate 1-carboxyvinyltransferase [Christensenellaceae bacterium]